nr:glucan biosynthesis protein G [Rhodovarius crocodyli]
MQRRHALSVLAGSAAFLNMPGMGRMSAQQMPQGETPFGEDTVRAQARELARKAFQAPDTTLPRRFAQTDYDAYRALRFRPERSIWRDGPPGFRAQLFHRGFLYREKVELFEVSGGKARPIAYDPSNFTLPEGEAPPADFGHAGFRLHAPINRPDVMDEVCAFLGASYFRAVGKDLRYGLSARGLGIRTADPRGEEFPLFKSFWLERPAAGAGSIVVHALLDSPSAAAAFRFTIRPGADTLMDVQASLYPRTDIDAVGIAPLTSMYQFAPNDRGGIDDYRPAVHDSDGLLIASSRGEQLWRPLHNPRELQVSTFAETNPRGFGLMQRARDFVNYNDLEAAYEKRPSLWVEPIGDWGEGAVQLVEIPTDSEVHDNIVAHWRPKEPLKARQEYNLVYRLHWLPDWQGNRDLARFTAFRAGAAGRSGRLFVLDVQGGRAASVPDAELPQLEVSASQGEIRNPVVQPNPETGGWRVHFELAPGSARLSELRAVLKTGEQPLSETWLYRWTA